MMNSTITSIASTQIPSLITVNTHTNHPIDGFQVQLISNALEQGMSTTLPSGISNQQISASLTKDTQSLLALLGKSTAKPDTSQAVSNVYEGQIATSQSITTFAGIVMNEESVEERHSGRKLLSLQAGSKLPSERGLCDGQTIPMIIHSARGGKAFEMETRCGWHNCDANNPYTSFAIDNEKEPKLYHENLEHINVLRYIPKGATNFRCNVAAKVDSHIIQNYDLPTTLGTTVGALGCEKLQLNSHADFSGTSVLACTSSTDVKKDMEIANKIHQDCESSEPTHIWVDIHPKAANVNKIDISCQWDECHSEPPLGLPKSQRRKTISFNPERGASDICSQFVIPQGSKNLNCQITAYQSNKEVHQKVKLPKRDLSGVTNPKRECNDLLVKTTITDGLFGMSIDAQASCHPKYENCNQSKQTEIWLDIQTTSAKSDNIDVTCQWNECQSSPNFCSPKAPKSKTISVKPEARGIDFCTELVIPPSASNLKCEMTVHQHNNKAQPIPPQKIKIALPDTSQGVNPNGECNNLLIQSTVKGSAGDTSKQTKASCYDDADLSELNTRCEQVLTAEAYQQIHSIQ